MPLTDQRRAVVRQDNHTCGERAPGLGDLFAVRSFRLQITGSLSLGTAYLLFTASCSWETWQLTGSATWVGIVTAAPLVPVPLLSPIGGVAADRASRRMLKLISSLLMSATVGTLAVLVALDLHTPLLLAALASLIGVGISFFDPSWLASIPDLVPQRLLPQAVSFNAAVSAATWAAGSALAGLLVATRGVATTLAISCAGYAAMAVAVLIDPTDGTRRDGAISVNVIRIELVTGVRHIRSHRRLRPLLLVVAMFGLTASSLQTLLPVLSADVLNGDADTYGVLIASFGTGALVGLLTRDRADTHLGERMVTISIAAFGLTCLTIAAVDRTVLAGGLLVAAGTFWTWVVATLSVRIQLLAASWVRARVMSFYVVTLLGSMSAGSIVAGRLAGVLEANGALAVSATGILLVGLVTTILSIPSALGLRAPKPAGLQAREWPASARHGRVMVATTWDIAPRQEETFLAFMHRSRAAYLSVGAAKWNLFRQIDDSTYNEVIILDDWQQYRLAMERLSTDDAAVLAAVSEINRKGDTCTIWSVEVDVT
jgi:MFS family permease